jgi:hypothetical protein
MHKAALTPPANPEQSDTCNTNLPVTASTPKPDDEPSPADSNGPYRFHLLNLEIKLDIDPLDASPVMQKFLTELEVHQELAAAIIFAARFQRWSHYEFVSSFETEFPNQNLRTVITSYLLSLLTGLAKSKHNSSSLQKIVSQLALRS